MNTKTCIKLLILLLIAGVSQSLYADDYQEYAKKVRQEVWAWQRPEFDNRDIPQKYANESAVIMAYHNQILASAKSKIRFDINTLLSVNKELYYTNIYRVLVKINDKNALDDYSEITFKEQDKKGGFRVSTKMTTVVGARIIKPDNTVTEVDVSEAVVMTEGRKDREEYRKLAISGLQVGDMLDYFVQEEMRIDNDNIPVQNFLFAGRHPMLSYSVHCEVSKNLTTEYRSVNGAPQFVKTENEDDYVLDAQIKDAAKIPNTVWVSPMREIPMIRLAILHNDSKVIYKPKSARKKGIYQLAGTNDIFSDAFGFFNAFGAMRGAAVMHTAIDKDLKRLLKERPDISKEELADVIFHLVKFRRNEYFASNPYTFAMSLNTYFNRNKIENKVGFATYRFGARGDEAVHYFDLLPMVVANGTQIFTYPTYFTIAGEVDADFEGETITLMPLNKYRANFAGLNGTQTQFVVPVTEADKNRAATTITAEISADDPSLLVVGRDVSVSGSLKYPYQRILALFEDADQEQREWLGIGKSFIEENTQSRRGRKYKDEYQSRFSKARESVKDSVKNEVKYHHGFDAEEVLDFDMLSSGITPQNRDLQYQVRYTVEGLVKRAGENLIVDAGKLIGDQMTLDSEDRARTIDVHPPFARSFENEIELKIPHGYRVDNVEALNHDISNACGQFRSRATVDGQTVRISVSKVYLHIFEPAQNWPQLEKIIDAANDFYGQSVVMRKM